MTKELLARWYERCKELGWQSYELPPIIIRPRGRPIGSLDSYDRELARKERLDAHAAIMRERYSASAIERERYSQPETECEASQLEQELVKFTPERLKRATLAQQVLSNEKQRADSRAELRSLRRPMRRS